MNQRNRLFLVTVSLCSSLAAEPLTFEQDVRPVFKAYCLDCHGGGEKLAGKLDLRLRRFAVRGGSSGPAVVAGDAAQLAHRTPQIWRDAAN